MNTDDPERKSEQKSSTFVVCWNVLEAFPQTG